MKQLKTFKQFSNPQQLSKVRQHQSSHTQKRLVSTNSPPCTKREKTARTIYKPNVNSSTKDLRHSYQSGQKEYYSYSPEVNLKRHGANIHRQLIAQRIQMQGGRAGSREIKGNTPRKGTSPNKISQIYEYLKNQNFHTYRHGGNISKNEDQNNKIQIQKLLNLRCKVVRMPKSMLQSQVEFTGSSQGHHIVTEKGRQLNTEGPEQVKICDILMKKLNPDLGGEQESQTQFKELLVKRRYAKQEAKKQYNNQQIYINIRKSYKNDEEQSPKKENLSVLYKTQKSALRKREQLFQKFTFKPKTAATSGRDKEDRPLNGW